MRRCLAALLLAGVLGGAGCRSDSRQLLQEAESRWRAGSYEDAIRLNTLLYERDRRGKYAPRALLNIADIYYLNLRQISDAIEHYQRLAEDLPDTPEALEARLRLAAIYENELRDLTQAIYEYDRILQSEKLDNRAEIEFRRAKAYFGIQEYDRALRVLRRLEDEGATGHLLHLIRLKLGNIHQVQKNYDEAIAAFEQVARSPCIECRRNAILCMTETYEDLFEFDRAVETIQKLDPTPENADRVRLEVARLREKQRRLDSPSAPDPQPTARRQSSVTRQRRN
jgi:tetratricopeptide (TPR) repeat protein